MFHTTNSTQQSELHSPFLCVLSLISQRAQTCHTDAPPCPAVPPGVRTWCGDFLQLPAYLGSAHAITMNAVFGNLPDPREALLKAALLLQPGGYILISHPMGRAWHTQLHKDDPEIVPHELPDRAALQQLVAGLPLQLVEYRDEKELYAAVLQVGVPGLGLGSELGIACRGLLA